MEVRTRNIADLVGDLDPLAASVFIMASSRVLPARCRFAYAQVLLEHDQVERAVVIDKDFNFKSNTLFPSLLTPCLSDLCVS